MSFAHVTCPGCGRPGAAVNEPSSGTVGVDDVDDLDYCYGEFGVVFHKDDDADGSDDEALRVYVAGPYTKGAWELNIRAVVGAADRLYDAGHVPFVPHTMTTLWALVNPRPKREWLDFDLQWLDACDALIRLDGDSEGADVEVEYAREHGIPVYDSVDEFIAKVGAGRDMTVDADGGVGE